MMTMDIFRKSPLLRDGLIEAGVNGAGKSTLYQLNPRLRNEHRVNADEILKEMGLDWQENHFDSMAPEGLNKSYCVRKRTSILRKCVKTTII